MKKIRAWFEKPLIDKISDICFICIDSMIWGVIILAIQTTQTLISTMMVFSHLAVIGFVNLSGEPIPPSFWDGMEILLQFNLIGLIAFNLFLAWWWIALGSRLIKWLRGSK